MGDIDYQYNPTHAAYYAAFSPIAWCLFFAWIILLSHAGYSSELGNKIAIFQFLMRTNFIADKFVELLEFRGFQVCTRISYSLYLVQFPIFFYNVGRLRAPLFFRLIPIFADIDEYIVIFLVSILLTLCIEMPFSNLKTLMLDGGKKMKNTRKSDKFDELEIKKVK